MKYGRLDGLSEKEIVRQLKEDGVESFEPAGGIGLMMDDFAAEAQEDRVEENARRKNKMSLNKMVEELSKRFVQDAGLQMVKVGEGDEERIHYFDCKDNDKASTEITVFDNSNKFPAPKTKVFRVWYELLVKLRQYDETPATSPWADMELEDALHKTRHAVNDLGHVLMGPYNTGHNPCGLQGYVVSLDLTVPQDSDGKPDYSSEAYKTAVKAVKQVEATLEKYRTK